MKINEIVVISGKGGTGKTTLTSSLIPYIDSLVIADCDVDAPDLDILLNGQLFEKQDFIGLKKAFLNSDLCLKCGRCSDLCRYGAISLSPLTIDPSKCEGCGLCAYLCPTKALTMKDVKVGEKFISSTIYGDFVHAKLIPGEETSGKLVAEVRKISKKIAIEQKKKNILIDGSPGLACNVISSITGASKVIIVVEPSMAGLHDLERIYTLTQNFRLPVYIVINKFDVSLEMTDKIVDFCKKNNLDLPFKIPFNKKIVEAIVNRKIPSIYIREFFNDLGIKNFIKKLL